MGGRRNPYRQTVTKKTRTYVVDGVEVTSTTMHVLGKQQDLQLRLVYISTETYKTQVIVMRFKKVQVKLTSKTSRKKPFSLKKQKLSACLIQYVLHSTYIYYQIFNMSQVFALKKTG